MPTAVETSQPISERPGGKVAPAVFIEVFKEELGEIRSRRDAAQQSSPQQNVELSRELSGLALSGGGIRSATYCLGVLQKFSELGLLARFDYLSTVSGGGFIGGWWSAWLSRCKNKGKDPFPPSEQIELCREVPYRDRVTTGNTDSSVSAGDDPVHHVRLFSNYLTPRKGALSLDTWRMITVGFRNLLLTWLILLPLMIAVILMAQLYFVHFQANFFDAPIGFRSVEWFKRVRLVLAPLIFLGGLFVTTSFAWVINTCDSDRKGTWYIRLLSFVFGITAGVFAAGVAVYETFGIDLWAIAGGGLKDLFASPPQLLLAVFLWLVVVFLILLCCYRPAEFCKLVCWIPIVSQYGPPATVVRPETDELSTRLTQASQAILVVFVAAGVVLGFFGFVQEVWAFATSQAHGYVVKAGGWIAALGSLASIAFTLWKASPAGGGDLHADGKRSALRQVAFAIAPPAALVIIGVLAAEAADYSVEHLLADHSAIFCASALVFVLLSSACIVCEWKTECQQPVAQRVPAEPLDSVLRILYPSVLLALIGVLIYWGPAVLATHPAPFPEFLAFTGVALMFGWVGIFGWYVDPNALSLHTFYKARLIRAYLGASNFERQKKTTLEITDADSKDDVRLSDLQNCQSGAPYHLINTTLNLVGGHDLGTAQRMAEPFLLSKLYCGTVSGYRPTKCYMNDRLTLGTAVAVSGAAVSPNMGSMTFSSAIAMLMTFFNIRLGYWAPTPNHPSWRSPQARHWPGYTIVEFLSQTTDQAKYCYLTDGGHFDNTGVYSLVQRGCKFIVMVDCGADPEPSFVDLGNLIRRCRIDFGAKIEIDISGLTNTASKDPATRCLRGTITYSPEHLASLGRPLDDPSATLILIKPSLTAKEATGKRKAGTPPATADIREFRITNSDYPNISTADQWFSEAQFESYRQLGEQSAETAARLFP